MTYKKLNQDDIFDWCEAHGQLEWLAEYSARTQTVKQYTYLKDEKGDYIKNAKGKRVVDKSVKPTVSTRPISFIKVKNEFCRKFMPELLPSAKAKKPQTLAERAKAALKK